MIRIMPAILLVFSNLFMTYAWYGHLRDFRTQSLFLVILLSWGVAFFEYCLQVPANRIGFQFLSLSQLKIMQEVITMVVFAGFCRFYMKQELTWDYLYAAICLVAASYFLFRKVVII